MTTRFSESEAAEIDAARGTTDRSEWLRTAALAAARASGRAPLSFGGIKIIADDRMPPDTIALASRSRSREGVSVAAARIKRESCPHRLPVGAYCKTCERAKT
jgi:hypothetical protein